VNQNKKIFYNSGLNLIESIPKESNRGGVGQCIPGDTKWQKKKLEIHL
jgi:hypothetical protein